MSEIRANTVSNAAGTGPATLTGQNAAKAWVNVDGNGTVAIRDSFNIASITDNSAGDITTTFSTSMSGGDTYSLGSCAGQNDTSLRAVCQNRALSTPTASSFRIQTVRADATVSAAEAVYITVNGDLA